jgi:ankyrin repeat protein
MQSDFEKIIAFKRAVENNHSEEVAQIIQQQIRGIDERLFENNASALIYASTNGHLEIAQALIEAHVNL